MNPTLEITVQIPCQNDCSFCPQQKLSASYDGVRKLSLKKLYDMLDKVPKHVRIDFSGMCEPFFHEEASHMMSKAYHAGFKLALYTTLCGITQDDISRLSASTKFELIMIHVPDTQYFTSGGSFKWKLEQFLDAGFEAQYMAMGPVDPEIRKVVPGDIIYPQMLSRGSNNECMERVPLKLGNIKCCIAGNDFDHNVLMPNGDMYLCCMDYGLGQYIGNLFDQSYEDIMNGEPLAKLKRNAASEDGVILCRRCEWGQV
jgi:radical SAM protein with 4Fe4S-binding SPASM domain